MAQPTWIKLESFPFSDSSQILPLNNNEFMVVPVLQNLCTLKVMEYINTT